MSRKSSIIIVLVLALCAIGVVEVRVSIGREQSPMPEAEKLPEQSVGTRTLLNLASFGKKILEVFSS